MARMEEMGHEEVDDIFNAEAAYHRDARDSENKGA
jgi:hypothetical protein